MDADHYGRGWTRIITAADQRGSTRIHDSGWTQINADELGSMGCVEK
jgi:hypothetical protein